MVTRDKPDYFWRKGTLSIPHSPTRYFTAPVGQAGYGNVGQITTSNFDAFHADRNSALYWSNFTANSHHSDTDLEYIHTYDNMQDS